MTFDDWLKTTKTSERAAAALLKISRGNVQRLRKPDANPTAEMMGRVKKATGGKVGKLEDWPAARVVNEGA